MAGVLKKLLTSAALSLLFVAMARPASAIEIREFDKYSRDQKSTYVSQMVGSAVRLLERQGRAQDAQTIKVLFSQNAPGESVSKGVLDFYEALDGGRVADLRRAESGRDRLHVEDALAVALKRNGIVMMAADLRAAVQQDQKNTTTVTTNTTPAPAEKPAPEPSGGGG